MKIVKEFHVKPNCDDESKTLETQIEEYTNENNCTVVSISLVPTRFGTAPVDYGYVPIGVKRFNILEYIAYVIFEH